MSFNTLSEATYVIDNLKPIAFYATIGVIAALLIASLIVFFTKKDAFTKFLKIAIVSFFVYALVFGVILLSFDVAKHYDAAYLEENYVSKNAVFYILLPALITVSLALITVILGLIGSKFKKSFLTLLNRILIIVTGLSAIALLVLIGLYYGGRRILYRGRFGLQSDRSVSFGGAVDNRSDRAFHTLR